MQAERSRSRQELYREFLEFIRQDLQRERKLAHRRMFSVILWCFILPAVVSITLLLLVKFRILPFSVRAYLDWMVLIFPVTYSLYILGSEVIAQVPAAFRRGGVANALGQSLKEAEWRERVGESMSRSMRASAQEWEWIMASFRVDLHSMQYRIRYLTALAGAVFFLIMQGIDSLTGTPVDPEAVLNRNPLMGWLESSSNDLGQFVGLALFLVLLYLSGNQTNQVIKRYLDCAELNQLGKRE
jgi:hypothetical protein